MVVEGDGDSESRVSIDELEQLLRAGLPLGAEKDEYMN